METTVNGIEATERDSSYQKQVKFEVKSGRMWFSSEVVLEKENGFSTKAGDVTINNSTTGSVSVETMKLVNEAISMAIEMAKKLQSEWEAK